MDFLKKLHEQREEKTQAMQAILDKAKTEERAMNEEEQTTFANLEKEIANIDNTIAAEERTLQNAPKQKTQMGRSNAETTAEMEERAFVDFVMKAVEQRDGEQNLEAGTNGAIIPTSIANRIIKTVKDRCTILERATLYHVNGTVKVPVWGDANGHNIKVAFVEEFQELVADAGKFMTVDLSGHLLGALSLISRKLENNASFNVTEFIINQMAEEIACFLEGKFLNGASGKVEGALETKTKITAASATVLTADELIDVQAKIKQVYQKNACWIMHNETYTALKKLKDENNRYLFQEDLTQEFPYRLLGKPVFLSDNMPKIATSAKAILYGDLSGLSINIREKMEIDVLREQFATKHALGVIAWLDVDSKVTDHQKLAILEMAAG